MEALDAYAINEYRIKQVDEAFRGSLGAKILWKNSRVLLGAGVLTKLCRKGPQRRQFFLFNDILVYGNIKVPFKKYNKQRIIQLEGAKLIPSDDADLNPSWSIHTADRSFVVYADTERDKQEWILHLKDCIDALSKCDSKKTIKHSPVWVPDNEAIECMVCYKTKFNALIRRHHCRNCGRVVCGSCSTKKFLLPHQSDKPVRVCDKCHEKLSSSGVDTSDSSGSDEDEDNVRLTPAENEQQ